MSDASFPQYLADRVRVAGTRLTDACRKMPADRLTWQPAIDGNTGRDAQDLMFECGFMNNWGAKAFRAGAVPETNWDEYNTQKAEMTDAEATFRWLQEGTEALAAALADTSPEKLGETLTHPFTQ